MSGLSPRQAEVLAAAADGVPLSVVAVRLGTTRTQVASRLSEAYRRLEVGWLPQDERRAEAVRVARREGWIPTEPLYGSQEPVAAPDAPEPHSIALKPSQTRTAR